MPGLPVNRTAIKSALFALASAATFSPAINGKTTWGLTSRRLRTFQAIDPSQQPSMFMVQHREGYLTSGVGRLTRRYMDIGFWCYFSSAQDSVIGDDYLDIMENSFEAALAPDDPTRGELTLGGLVYWCRITREDNLFIRDPGDLDGIGLLILPVRVLLP